MDRCVMELLKSILIPEIYLPIIYIIFGYIIFRLVKKVVTTIFDRQKRINKQVSIRCS